MKKFLSVLLLSLFFFSLQAQESKPPVRFAIIGLVHDHAGGFIPHLKGREDVQLAGIVEPNAEVAARAVKHFNLDPNLIFPTLEALLARTNIQAVATFTATFDHRRIAEECARLGIHVMMMEKPLAVNMKHARAIARAAKKGDIKIIVNYETTWYPGNQEAYRMVHDQHAIGDLRKIVVHDGHPGPKEIGCSKTFTDWLTDPVLNGGGALPDFGCYGADLVTWLMDGERPESVLCVTQHIKPDVYPKVEDEATVLLTYPRAQGILQASWNWPYNRKDIEIYGKTGYILIPKSTQMRVLKTGGPETEVTAPEIKGPDADSVSYLAAVVRGEIQPAGLSSLGVNMIVTEILDAARKSAQTGRRVDLPERAGY
ncbi:MAG TPA: Gfo/Idh/MocA family oxidoreductase [Verrucomicrobiae bacterium]|nr:Gfo/Idh/MocA family oxidoreductase [Verrucomicrobiae bacterium]